MLGFVILVTGNLIYNQIIRIPFFDNKTRRDRDESLLSADAGSEQITASWFHQYVIKSYHLPFIIHLSSYTILHKYS